MDYAAPTPTGDAAREVMWSHVRGMGVALFLSGLAAALGPHRLDHLREDQNECFFWWCLPLRWALPAQFALAAMAAWATWSAERVRWVHHGLVLVLLGVVRLLLAAHPSLVPSIWQRVLTLLFALQGGLVAWGMVVLGFYLAAESGRPVIRLCHCAMCVQADGVEMCPMCPTCGIFGAEDRDKGRYRRRLVFVALPLLPLVVSVAYVLRAI